ncbi:MAG: shikimate dehydrogenase [Candidatus Scalinduaceae bacterium]
MICVPVTARNIEDAVFEMSSASKHADIDIIELRLDYIPEVKNAEICLEKLLKGKTKPVIVTNRPRREGGNFEGSEKDRLCLLQKAIELGADYVDVEYDSASHISRRDGSKIIVSYHNFKETPHNINKIYEDISQCKPDIVKIVTYANDITDNVRIFELLKIVNIPTISFCMGEFGCISRILTRKYGGVLTFASLERGKESAPGQLTVDELSNIYHFKSINVDTGIYGIVGNPISHSISPIIHNSSFSEKGLNNVYVPMKVLDIGSFIKEFRKMDLRGLSVTIPHKESIIPFLDDIENTARKIGAVNTVVNQRGKLIGYNTDCMAAIKGLVSSMSGEEIALKGKKVAIIGAGGAARAIAFGLKGKGCDITIHNRTLERAHKLSVDVGCGFKGFDEIKELNTDILINCTSIGMFPKVEESPVPKDVLKEGMIVFDAVYNPIETRLLHDAKERGCYTVNGLTMFINQAAEQFRLWTNIEPPVELMKNVAEDVL